MKSAVGEVSPLPQSIRMIQGLCLLLDFFRAMEKLWLGKSTMFTLYLKDKILLVKADLTSSGIFIFLSGFTHTKKV